MNNAPNPVQVFFNAFGQLPNNEGREAIIQELKDEIQHSCELINDIQEGSKTNDTYLYIERQILNDLHRRKEHCEKTLALLTEGPQE